MATCLNSLAETGVAYPMRAPYAHTLLAPIIPYEFLLFPINSYYSLLNPGYSFFLDVSLGAGPYVLQRIFFLISKKGPYAPPSQ